MIDQLYVLRKENGLLKKGSEKAAHEIFHQAAKADSILDWTAYINQLNSNIIRQFTDILTEEMKQAVQPDHHLCIGLIQKINALYHGAKRCQHQQIAPDSPSAFKKRERQTSQPQPLTSWPRMLYRY